jgi:2-desacetyl-2-hydroxyethyl bacteriochlorophyllide A dehydrogenase
VTAGTMRAAVVAGPGQLEVRDVPVPEVGPGEVLVAVELCGVCGTDLHMVLDGWGTPGGWHGHEWTGQVAAVGEGVAGWTVGDAVVGGPSLACGRCRACRDGRPSLCAGRGAIALGPERGAFATYKLAGAGTLRARPPGLAPRAAALAEPLAVAMHAITRSGVGPGESVLVLGAGPIGALAIAALRAAGVDDVTCAEPGEGRRALAARVGATAVVHPDDLEAPSTRDPGGVVDGAVDVALECSGRPRAMEAGLRRLARGGTLVLVGSGIEPPRLDHNRILLNELVVTGAFNYDDGGTEAALDLLASGRLPVEDLLEPEVVPLDGLLDAMRGLADGRLAGKVLVRP